MSASNRISYWQNDHFFYQPAAVSSLLALSGTSPQDLYKLRKMKLTFQACIKENRGPEDWGVLSGLQQEDALANRVFNYVFASLQQQQCADVMTGIGHDILKSRLYLEYGNTRQIVDQFKHVLDLYSDDDAAEDELIIPQLLTTKQVSLPLAFFHEHKCKKTEQAQKAYLEKNISSVLYDPKVMTEIDWNVFCHAVKEDRGENKIIYPAQFVAIHRQAAIDEETLDSIPEQFVCEQFNRPDMDCYLGIKGGKKYPLSDKRQGRFYMTTDGWDVYMMELYQMVPLVYCNTLEGTCDLLSQLEQEFIDNYYSATDARLAWAQDKSAQLLGVDPTHYTYYLENASKMVFEDKTETWPMTRAEAIDRGTCMVVPKSTKRELN